MAKNGNTVRAAATLEDVVVVCEHHTLRLAGGTGRVDDRGEIVRSHGERAVPIALCRSVASSAAPTDSSSLNVRSTPGSGSSSKLMAVEGRGSASGSPSAWPLVRPWIRTGRRLPGVVEHGRELLGREVGDRRHVGGADHQAGIVGNRPLGSVLGEDRHRDRPRAALVAGAVSDRRVARRVNRSRWEIGRYLAVALVLQRIRPVVALDRLGQNSWLSVPGSRDAARRSALASRASPEARGLMVRTRFPLVSVMTRDLGHEDDTVDPRTTALVAAGPK